MAETVTPKYAGNYSAVRRHAGDFSAVKDFSFLAVTRTVNSKVDGNYLIIIIWRCIARTFSLLLSSHYKPFRSPLSTLKMAVLFYPTGSISPWSQATEYPSGVRENKKQKQNGSSQKNQRRIKNQHTVVETKTGKKLRGAKSTKDIHMPCGGNYWANI